MKQQTFIVQANRHVQQVITCSVADQFTKNIPVPVVFFYRESFEYQELIECLKEVLSDFPIFAGILKQERHNLYIDCNNQGVQFEIKTEDSTLNQILEEFTTIKKDKLINMINPQKVISSQSFVMNIQLTYFACGGMALGICWHHSVGDMHTFMQFMKAWSNSVNKKEYTPPLIVQERNKYLEDKIEESNNDTPGVRYLSGIELLKLVFYSLFQARDKISLRFYFSENELNNMKQSFSENTTINLSINDVLCAHLFSIISELDDYNQERYLSIAINYRYRINLPKNLLGNFVSSIDIVSNQITQPLQIAEELRMSVDNFRQRQMNFLATKKFIEEKGGLKNLNRFISKGIDPLKRTLLITSWANFGTYDITFGDSKPFYFSSFGEYPFPWLSSITEGFSKNGRIYSVLVPSKLAKKLMQDDNLRKIHSYRDDKEVMPELVRKLEWLL